MTIKLASGTEITLTTEELQEFKAILAAPSPTVIPWDHWPTHPNVTPWWGILDPPWTISCGAIGTPARVSYINTTRATV